MNSSRQLSTRSSPLEYEKASESFRKRKPGQHRITIGKADKSTVDLLEDVPEGAQLFLEYTNVKAWVPSMAPGGNILPGIPKITLPTFSRNAQNEAPAESDKMRQVRSGLSHSGSATHVCRAVRQLVCTGCEISADVS